MDKDIVVSIDVVEPGLVNAVHLLNKELGRPLKGIALVHRSFLDYPGRPVDTTGLFEEVVVDYDNADELQKTVLPFSDRILAVTTRYEDAMHHFSQLVPFVPYAYTPTESSLIWSTEKPLMRDRLKNYDPQLVPQYVRLEEQDIPNGNELTRNFAFPVVIKPGSLWSSFLVSRCDDRQQLESQLRSTFSIINNVYGRLRRETKPAVLVEEMIQGDMYSTDVYVSHDGTIRCLPLIRVFTDAVLGRQSFSEHHALLPVDLSQEESEAGFIAAKSAVRALGLRSTTAHVELFKTKNGWKIIELGARIGGSREELYRESFGIEHHYNDLANRAGMEPKIPAKLLRYAREEDIYADKEGVIEAIDGIEEARELASMAVLKVPAKPGDKALFADKGGDVLVQAILSNADRQQLEADAAKLRQLVKFKISAE